MTTKLHSSMRNGLWRLTASLMTLAVVGTALNLQAQVKDARDPFASPPLTPAQVEAVAEAEKLGRIQSTLQRWGDEGMLSEGRLKKRLNLIRTYPELGKYLAQIADQMIEQKSPEISDVLDAMSMRSDVPPEAITRYIELTKRMIAGKTAKDIKDGFEEECLRGIPDVLASHLTPENEDLLIVLLQFGTQGHAHRALGRAGTIRALPAMQKYADEYEQYARTENNGSVSLWLKEIKESLMALSKRVSETKQKNDTGH